MNYLITVIVPIYKAEDYIERCARSLFEQTFDSIEYVFVDDCSPDNSIRILQRLAVCYPGRTDAVRFVRHKENEGVAAARNSGLRAAGGDYIIYCDGDDWMELEAIEKMYKEAILTGADIVWTDFYYTYPNHETLSVQKCEMEKMECIKALLCEKMHGAVWNKLIKRDLYDKNNIRFLVGLNIWEDLRVNVQLFFSAQSVSYLPEAFYHYVQYNAESLCAGSVSAIVHDTIGNAEDIIKFLNRNNISEEVNMQVNFLKLAAKRNLLVTTSRHAFLQWRLIYPEADRYILSYKVLPLRLRLIGWCTAHGLWAVINFWILLKKQL